MIVWYCAEKVYPGKYFDRYAILGDDIVIGDSKVASLYRNVLETIQVTISEQKSLISKTGGAERLRDFV